MQQSSVITIKQSFFNLLAEFCQENPAINEAIEDQIRNLNKDPNALDALIEKQKLSLSILAYR